MSTDAPSSKGHLYTAYAAYRAPAPDGSGDAAATGAEAEASLAAATLRGAYHLTGFRAEADVMLWLTADSSDALQDALGAFRHTELDRKSVV